MLLTYNLECGRNHDLHTRSIERVIRTMTEPLDRPLSNEEMASIACFSPGHFNRLFHKMTGIPPVQFHYALRIARAKELLIDTDMGVTEICYEVGYNSLGTFISRFGKMVGVSPTNFRRLARAIASTRLADFPLPQQALPAQGNGHLIAGSIERSDPMAIVFCALFRRGIPEGVPYACTVVHDGNRYALPVPPEGLWHILAVAVPRSSDGVRLLTLKDVTRGRSAPIKVAGGYWSGRTDFSLAPPSALDPPILAAIPVQVARLDDLRDLSPRRQRQKIPHLQPTALAS